MGKASTQFDEKEKKRKLVMDQIDKVASDRGTDYRRRVEPAASSS